MKLYQEPNADLPEEIYKDWLFEFNNNDDLREINFAILTAICGVIFYGCHQLDNYTHVFGIGDGSEDGGYWFEDVERIGGYMGEGSNSNYVIMGEHGHGCG